MSDFANSVFLNCPFDDDYIPLFNAIVFTTHRCGFILRCAQEFQDTSNIRIEKISELIRGSKYSIHDLSRVGLDGPNLLPRFNMPLELGMVIGCINFGKKNDRERKYLIIESEKHRFKQFISDISGQDIKEHKDSPEQVIKCIRSWLSDKTENRLPAGSKIFEQYQEFKKDLPALCKEVDWTESELTFKEYISLVVNWLALKISQ